MKRHCCFCGLKAPPTVRGTNWLSMRADNDPTHCFCPSCRKEKVDQIKGVGHALHWRQARIGCRISPDPRITKWNGSPIRRLASFPAVRRAALAIAYDNGMINRLEPQGAFLAKMETLICIPEYDDDLAAIETWLAALTDEQLEIYCNGDVDSAERLAISKNEPRSINCLLSDIFEL